ncbi:MAG: hypothetical protein A3I26_02425 [Candidatus Yanofskybacteria bacterium RIFCSPLOWO2_02_FULL_43_10]|nr:MAG: hypothetical protein A3C69_00125 [Candidatus Yanofskybacteria bacterium RIFCSPHIGHO2_02_FULL_43_12]OGN30146.1 MAG: hypothetical protein A3I26_02425 [Candidatus Yanofskybacteria bacterium RIFCSPLOWO2_02_FULL_43_10]
MTRDIDAVCMVCKLGEIVQDLYQDYHCNVCGLKYKFLPAKTLAPPKSDDSMVQIQPGLYVARESKSIFKKNR